MAQLWVRNHEGTHKRLLNLRHPNRWVYTKDLFLVPLCMFFVRFLCLSVLFWHAFCYCLFASQRFLIQKIFVNIRILAGSWSHLKTHHGIEPAPWKTLKWPKLTWTSNVKLVVDEAAWLGIWKNQSTAGFAPGARTEHSQFLRDGDFAGGKGQRLHRQPFSSFSKPLLRCHGPFGRAPRVGNSRDS